jgi:ribose 5-phosphate isomerase B
MGARKIITEQDILDIEPGGTLHVSLEGILTPLARDTAAERRVKLVYDHGVPKRTVAVGSDHAGFEMKERLKSFLKELGLDTKDFGAHDPSPVDYPDIALAVATAVTRGDCDVGIIIDGAGIGSCMAANKVPGIRAALCYDAATAQNSREHNFANVLTLGARMIDTDKMREIVKVWLETDYGEERHARRVKKIADIEKKFQVSGFKF